MLQIALLDAGWIIYQCPEDHRWSKKNNFQFGEMIFEHDMAKKKSKGLAEDSFLEYKKTGGKRRWDIFLYELHSAIVSQSLTNQSCQAYMTYDKEKHANPCPSIASHILKSGNPMPHDPHLHFQTTSTRNWVKICALGNLHTISHLWKNKKISSSQPPCRGYMLPIQGSYP